MDWTTLTGELNLEALSEQIEQLFPNFSIDFSSLLGQILSGNAKEAFAGLAASLKNGVLAEMAGMKNLLLTLLIIGVLSALFTVVMQSFDNSGYRPFYFLPAHAFCGASHLYPGGGYCR